MQQRHACLVCTMKYFFICTLFFTFVILNATTFTRSRKNTIMNDTHTNATREKTKKKKKSRYRTPTTTTMRCRYSSFDHPKTNDFLSSAVVPTFLSSIEVFAFPNAKETTATTTTTEEERGGKKRRLSIEALDSASFSVIRKCTIADVLNAHFVHEYVKEEKEEKKALSVLSIGGGDEEEEDVFSIALGRFEAILSERLCQRLGVSGPLSRSSSSLREEERRRRVVAINLRSDNFAPGRTTHDRVTENARRVFRQPSSREKVRKSCGNDGGSNVLLAHFEVGNEAKEIERSSFASGESAVEISSRNIEKYTGEVECEDKENRLFELVESFRRSVESKGSTPASSSEQEETLRKILEMVSVAALRSQQKEKRKKEVEAVEGSTSARRFNTARWSGFLTYKHLERTLKATNEMIQKDDEFEFFVVCAHAFPNQPSCESLRTITRTAKKKKKKNERKRKKPSTGSEEEKEEEEEEEEEEVEILTPRSCAYLVMQNQRYVSFLPVA